MKIFIVLVLFICAGFHSYSQERLVQVIRGRVIDKITEQPLPSAGIVIESLNPVIGTVSDENGYFRLENVPVGRQDIKVQFLGYRDFIIKQFEVVSGKEMILNVAMDENIITGKEVVITARKSKSESINEMSLVGSRTFSVEETKKYAGSWGDPSRMVANYAGVIAVSDMRNDIVVRGNSPIGVQWRMNGVEIPNPNHFAISGSSGGAISMINNNLLDNSDFMTGAFPAEYGNALSAVFDLKMRTGNNERFEFISQAGVQGFEGGAEGPINKKNHSSFLINYRYSTLAVLDKLGISIIDAVPKFQDVSFNINYPLKHGNISLFGIGGISKAIYHPPKDSTLWYRKSDQNGYFSGSRMGTMGVICNLYVSQQSYLRFIFSSSINNPVSESDSTGCDYNVYVKDKVNLIEQRNIFSVLFNSKLSNHHKIRTGIAVNNINSENSVFYYSYWPIETKYDINSFKGSLLYSQSYVQWKYDVTDNLSLNNGIHFIYLTDNKKYSFEPRLALLWNFSALHSLNVGLGKHSQLQPVPVYFAEYKDSLGNISYPNQNMDFTKSFHAILGYNYQITENLRFKTEVYHQWITDVPVAKEKPVYSLLNFGTDDNIFTNYTFLNTGKGRNYGVEATFEQYFYKNLYFLITASFYNSEYLDGNNDWRSSRYNCNYAWNFLAGKEFKLKKNNLIGFSTTVVHIGGRHYTPIDLNASRYAGKSIYIDSLSYTEKYPDFFKLDIRIRLRHNAKNFSQELALELGNVLNRKNVDEIYFDKDSESIKYHYLLSRIPVVFYKIEF